MKDCSNDMIEPVKDVEETKAECDVSEPSVTEQPCESQPTEDERNTSDTGTPATAAVPQPQPAVKEKPSKTSKERSDRKRERRKERKSESGSPAVLPPDRSSPVCNGTAADDMNVCKYVHLFGFHTGP